jgi:hypothetical protein
MEEEKMELRIKQLVRRLVWLGYSAYEIGTIVRDAIGDDNVGNLCPDRGSLVIRHLEQYEQLGLNYLLTYSK